MSGKIKIAFCIPNMIIGGVETVFVNTINELIKEKNLELQIITHGKIREPLYVNWLKSHPGVPVYVYYPLCNWFEDIRPKCHGVLEPLRKIIFSLYKKYRRLVIFLSRRFKDVDVFIDYRNFEFFKELKYYNTPKIAWAHSALSYFESNDIFKRLSQYSQIIGITDDFVDDFKTKYPEYADKITRIYNPMNISDVLHRAQIAKTPHGKYFCHVSRLVAGKDIRTLLNAFDFFSAKHPGVKLYIIGDGDMASEFQKYAQTLKSNKQIIFTGAMSNPYGIMQGAVANILSSEFEGLPTVILESVILGVPCISSNCKNGPREILLDGMGGLLFDIGNAEMLSECMTYVYQSPSGAKDLVTNAGRGLKRFDASVISAEIHNLIKQVL